MTIGILLDLDNEYKKTRYVFEIFFSILGMPYSFFSNENILDRYPLIIYYANKKMSEYLRHYLEGGGAVINIPYIKTDKSEADELICEIKESDISVAEFDKGTLINLNVDIISTAYYLLTLQEEVNSKKRDEHGRFIGEFSSLNKKNLILEPVINEYIDLLDRLIRCGFDRRGMPLLKKCCWPDGEDFAVSLTHDVDVIKKWTIFDVLKSKKLFYRILGDMSLIGMTGRSERIWELNKIVDMEKRFGYKSAFFFSVDGSSRFDVTYKIDDVDIKNILREISKSGWEVGLHATYDSYIDEDKMAHEKEALESIIDKKVVGCRQHYLRFEIPSTWNIHDKLKFLYDTSLGFPDICGFRCGICHPFNPYNDFEKKKYDLIEIPLSVMDVTLAEYMNLSPLEALEKIKELIGVVKQHKGVVTLLWHHRYFNDKKYPNWPDVYEKILEYLDGLNAYIAPSAEIAKWWEIRNSLEVVNLELDNDKGRWALNPVRPVESISLEILTPEEADKYNMVIENIPQYEIQKSGKRIEVKIKDLAPNCNAMIRISKM